MANGRCYHHGGNTPSGIASPHYKHGRNARFVPKHLTSTYYKLIADPDLLSLRHDIALLDARRDSLLEQLSSGESWHKVVAAADTLKIDRTPAALEQLLEAIAQGSTEQAVWSEWAELGEKRGRQTDREVNRLKALNAYITVQDSMVLVTSLLSSVKRHVTDQAALRGIAQDVKLLLNQPATGQAE